jgi:(3R)-3-hydroxyacyl-CoA dehydrogenase / 3a,7a,12a-trihydroxy-5b-cholest-24-enoyl-CoA hydratase / enoyl-CoA hydratase 2
MTSGKADPQKLFMGGKLKITGNIMASQKLMFLKKVDPQAAMEAIQKARGGAVAAAPAASAPAAPASAPAANAPLGSADVFVAIRDYVEKTPDLVSKVATVFQFHLKDPDSSWVIDAKNGKGGVTAGTADADVTLTLADSDFLDMTSGKADPQKLFMGGKLKITGNIMASQKLMFLKKVDPQAAMEAIQKARAGSAPAAPAAATPASKSSKAPGIFAKLAERLAKTPELSAEVGAVIQFVVKDPDGAWAVDLKASPGTVKEGRAEGATTTITLAEEDLVALARGEGAYGLYQHGKMRVDGEIRPAHKLGFMKDLA